MWTDGETYDTERFAGASGQTVRSAETTDVLFQDCVFDALALEAHVFRTCVFERCQFIGCTMNRASLMDCTLTGVSFERCRLMGIDWTAARQFVFDVRFHTCQLDYGWFENMRLKKQAFVDCRMLEVELSGADLTGASFDGCDLERTRFNNANLSKADFRGAEHLFIDPRTARLAKTQVGLQTAIMLVESMGLSVDPSR